MALFGRTWSYIKSETQRLNGQRRVERENENLNQTRMMSAYEQGFKSFSKVLYLPPRLTNYLASPICR